MALPQNDKTLSRIEKLQYMKAWLRQSSWSLRFAAGTLAGGAALGGLGALLLQVGGSPAGLATLIAPASIGYFALFNQYRDSLYAQYKRIFASKKQAKQLLASTDYLMQKLAGSLGPLALKDGLRYTASYLSHQALAQLPPVKTIGTRDLKKNSKLSQNDGEAAMTLVRACLYALVNNHKEYQAKSTATSSSATFELPLAAQFYIADHFNDLISLDPAIFGKDVLDSRQPGLYTVVQSMVAMQCTAKEIRSGVKNWLDTQRAVKPSVNPGNLPTTLF